MIGAGHNALVCAIALARAGLEVTVLEQAPVPGGAVRSAELTLPGHVHDLHAAFFPQAMLSPALRRLSLEEHGVDWITPPVAMVHPFADGSGIALHSDPVATCESLELASPGAGEQWGDLVEGLWPHREAIAGAALSAFPPVGPGLELALGLRGRALWLARSMLGSAAAFGSRIFDAERPTAWLCGSVGHSDISPGDGASAAIAFGLAFFANIVGWPLPRGGAGRLTDALVSALAASGGELRCAAPVAAIEIASGGASGVRLEGGERLAADAVVATVGPRPLLGLLPAGALGRRLTRRLSRWRYGLGTFKLDLALTAPVPWSCPAAREAGVVHVGGELAELYEAPLAAARGEVPARPMVVVGQQSLHDPTRAPAGAHTLYAYTRLPSDAPVADTEVAELLERRIEEFAPGFRNLIRARSVRGPRDQEREDPALVGGDLSAGSVARDQLLVFRPAPGMCRYRTPVDGLYVAGASVHPGPGVHGVSGEGAARALLSDRSARRRRIPGLGR